MHKGHHTIAPKQKQQAAVWWWKNFDPFLLGLMNVELGERENFESEWIKDMDGDFK